MSSSSSSSSISRSDAAADNDSKKKKKNKEEDHKTKKNQKDDDDDETEKLAADLLNKLTVGGDEEEAGEEQVEEEEDGSNKNKTALMLRRIARLMEQKRNILVLTGAGVSVAAGIPDFRTPGTGLYDNLHRYNLPYAEAVFDIQYYCRVTPQPFVQLAAELWPSFRPGDGGPQPTLTHSFVSLLAEKGRLLRNYSQNIDGLEHQANIPEHKLVECHGHFRTASCTACGKPAEIDVVRETIVVQKQAPKCRYCKALVKPDIVFFGEPLPERFHRVLPRDLQAADLCLILGTSLQVPPVARIPSLVDCPRILLNRQAVDIITDNNMNADEMLFYAGDCDDSILQIAQLLGWEQELRQKHAQIVTRRRGPPDNNENNDDDGDNGGGDDDGEKISSSSNNDKNVTASDDATKSDATSQNEKAETTEK